MQQNDHYKTLGIGRTASRAEIKAAYRELAKKYHPDRNHGNKSAEEAFKEVQEAYATLSNSEKRRNYDLKLKYGRDFSKTSYQGPSYQKATYYSYEAAASQKQKHAAADDFIRKQKAAAIEKENALHFKVAVVTIVVVLATIFLVFYSPWFKTEEAVPYQPPIVQSSTPAPITITPTIINADSPYDIVFGEGIYDTSASNRVYIYNTGSCAAIVCIVQNKPPFRTIRNEYIDKNVRFMLDGIPDGEYYLKAYFGENWEPSGKLPDGTIAGRFRNEKGFRAYNDKAMLLDMKQSYKGSLSNFSSYEFKFNLHDSSGSQSLTAEQFFR